MGLLTHWKILRKLTPPCSYESDPRRAAKLTPAVEGRILNGMQAGAGFHLISLHFVF